MIGSLIVLQGEKWPKIGYSQPGHFIVNQVLGHKTVFADDLFYAQSLGLFTLKDDILVSRRIFDDLWALWEVLGGQIVWITWSDRSGKDEDRHGGDGLARVFRLEWIQVDGAAKR